MIQKESVMISHALADEISQKGMVVRAKPNTVLSELVKSTNDALLAAVAETEGEVYNENNFAEAIELLTDGTLEKPSIHSQNLDSVIDLVSKAVSSHFSFARNVVKPLIVEYAEAVHQQLDAFRAPKASESFNIEVLDVPQVLEDVSFVDSLKHYKDAKIITPDFKPNHETKTGEDVIKMMMTGDSYVDEAIGSWAGSKGVAYFESIWASFFANPSKIEGMPVVISYQDLMQKNAVEKLDTGLALYLIASKCFNDPESTGTPMGLMAYQNGIAQVRDFAGALLASSIQMVEGYIQSKMLVLSVNPAKKSCKLFGHNYRDWLEKGGSPEVIFGVILSNRKLSTQLAIDEKVEELLADWRSYSVFYEAAEANKAINHFKSALLIAFNNLMSNLTEEEKGYIQTDAKFNENVARYVEEEIENLKTEDMNDIYMTCARVICNARFYYTDAYKIISSIANATKINKNIDIREAALIAMVEYVVDYVADQMTKQPL